MPREHAASAPHEVVDRVDRAQLELIAEVALASAELELGELLELSLERICQLSGADAADIEVTPLEPHDDDATADLAPPRAPTQPTRRSWRARPTRAGDEAATPARRSFDVPLLAERDRASVQLTLELAAGSEAPADLAEVLAGLGSVLSQAIEREQRLQLRRELDAAQRARRRQQAMRRRLFTILESITDAFFALDERWSFTYLNAAAERMLGGGRRELLGRLVWPALSPLLGAQLRPALEQAASRAERSELVVQTDDGRWLQVRIVPIDPDDVPDDAAAYLLSVYARDITQQRRFERDLARSNAELRERNAELDQFAYVASHDLKAPLRGISNLATWIRDELADDAKPQVREDLDLLRQGVRRMDALIDALLAYSRAGRGEHAPEPIDVDDLVDEVTELLGAREVTWVRSGAPTTLTSQRTPLLQVLQNLASNAIKHGRGAATRIEIGWQRDGDALRFFVRDDGPGIDPHHHERIFVMFKTLRSRDEVEGAGIGLALVKKLVEGRGGRVWLESTPGAGATFYFTWPAARAR